MKYFFIVGFVACAFIFTTAATSSTSFTKDCKINQTGCDFVVTCYKSINIHSFNPKCSGEARTTLIFDNSQCGVTRSYTGSTSGSFDRSVREIRGISNTISNLNSHSFIFYPKCERIDLSENNLVTIEGNAFQYLNLLESLNLTGNHISALKSNSFCISADKNNNLSVLDLSNNRLIRVDSEFNEVPHLKTLYLQGNRLSYIADNAFKSLKDLNHLYLQHNRLTSLNNSLTHLKDLLTLNVAYNHLSQLSGHEITRLYYIVDINLSHNELISIQPNSFRHAFDLQKADLSYNKINITIGSKLFENNENLKYLDFYSNNITGIEVNAFQNCDLHYLGLEKNNISGDIKDELLSNLQKITRLDLSGQTITGIRNYAFSDLKKLLHLNLSNNDIIVVDNYSFIRSSITVLDLSHNMISNLDFLTNGLTNLIELYVNDNNIAVVSKNTFVFQTQLKKLDLSVNNIMNVKEFTLPLLNLQTLILNFVASKSNETFKSVTSTIQQTPELLDIINFAKRNSTIDGDLYNVTEPTQTKEVTESDSILKAELRASRNELDVIKKSVLDLTNMMKNFSSYVVNQENKREHAEVEIWKAIGRINQGRNQTMSPADKKSSGYSESNTTRATSMVLLSKLGVEVDRSDPSGIENFEVPQVVPISNITSLQSE